MTDSRDAAAEPPLPPAAQRKPLKVLIGADTFTPDVNGAARFAERLAAGLVARGHEVHVMAPSAGRRYGTWIEEHDGQRMVMHRLHSWRWPPHPWLRFALPWRIKRNSARVLDEVKPDVVHFQSPVIVGRGLTIEAEKRGIRVIGTNHLMPENMLEFSLIPKWLQDWAVRIAWKSVRRTFSRAEAVTTPTHRAAQFLEAHKLAALVSPVPNELADDAAAAFSDLFSRVMVEKVEPQLGQGRATILYGYPISEAALARPSAEDPRVAERFELYCCGVELANAFGELTDPTEQRRRFAAEMDEKERVYGERYPLDEDFLAALAVMPQASGSALGFDRLVMLATGATRIDDVIWAPVAE